MPKVKNPHDIYAKRVFRKISLAADFFRHYLPPEIAALPDFDQLVLDEGAFADKRLRQHFSDLLFRAPLKAGGATFLQLLLEHKSAPPPRIGVQLLRYQGLSWSSVPDDQDLPPIIPVVLYHGREKWNIAQNFGALFKLPEELAVVRSYLPEFRFHLCDLAAYNDGALSGSGELQAKLSLLKHIFGKDFRQQFPGLLREFLEQVPEPEVTEEVEAAIWYAQNGGGITQSQAGDALTQALMGSEDKTMELRFVTKWEKQGRKLGRIEERKDFALSLLQKKFGALNEQLAAQIADLPAPQLKDLGLALLDFQQPQDLTAWLKRQAAAQNRKPTQEK